MKLKKSLAHAQSNDESAPPPCLEVCPHRVDVLDRGIGLFVVAGSRCGGCGVVVSGVGDGCGERGEWWVKLSGWRGEGGPWRAPVRSSN